MQTNALSTQTYIFVI